MPPHGSSGSNLDDCQNLLNDSVLCDLQDRDLCLIPTCRFFLHPKR